MLCACLVALAWPSLQAAEVREPEPFAHGKGHVQSNWFRGVQPEVARDCRGCHVFTADGRHDPRAACTSCHYREFEPATAPGYELELAQLRASVAVSGFGHVDHARLACRICHVESNFEDREPRKSASGPGQDLPIPAGFQHCATCHGAESEFERLAGLCAGNQLQDGKPRADWQARFFERLDADPRMAPDRLEPFRHDQHLRAGPQTLADMLQPRARSSAIDGRCSDCHHTVLEARTDDLQEKTWDAAACASCHRGAQGPLRFARASAQRIDPAARTFAHADHLRASSFTEQRDLASAAAYRSIEQESCYACHAPDDAGSSFVLAPDAAHYSGCTQCHDRMPWTAAGDGAEGRERGWWHGEWKRCTTCHEVDGSEMRVDLARPEIARRRPLTFRFVTQAHPDITHPKDADCSACHRAEPEGLPSRVREQAFRHDTHVPPLTADNRAQVVASCQTCHGSRVGEAASSAELGLRLGAELLEPGDERHGLTYDPAACVQCHAGSPPRVTAWRQDERAVTGFPHRQHLQPSVSPALDCLACHVNLEGPGEFPVGDVGVRSGAASCKACHRHDEGEPARITGRAQRAEVSSCKLCHAQALPAPGAQLSALRSSTVGGAHGLAIDASQIHPPGETCASCHLAETDAAPHRRPQAMARVAARQESPHEESEPKPDNCLGCHWNKPQEGMATRGMDPTSSAMRACLGSEMADYPGKLAKSCEAPPR